MNALIPLNDAQWAGQNASYTGTAGATTGWPTGPEYVLVMVTTDAYVRVGAGVTATTADTLLPAFTPAIFKVPPVQANSAWRVSAIQLASGGTVYAKPLTGQ